MLKRILFLSVALSLFLAVPLQATARTWINLPEKQGAEGDPDDGNHSPSVSDQIKTPPVIDLFSVLSPLGQLGPYAWSRSNNTKVADDNTYTSCSKPEASK